MHSTTLLTGLLAMSTTGWAQYRLQHDYMQGGPGSFLSNFAFFTAPDPTNGFVEYVDQGTAQAAGMISTSTGSVRLGVNSRDTTTTGRQSIRLTSHNSYESGLIVLDLSHMPGGVCGTWPAFWMVGPNWPTQGEIDIIEGVNDQAANQMTLHTGGQCSIGGGSMLGNIIGNNCDVSGGDNTGCGIGSNDRATYGTGFNQAGGGTYATEWSSSAISVYFFPRGKEPQDINSGNPNPASWGEPLAHFSGGCDMSRSFTNQQIIFDTTFCGDWAGEVWGSSGCSAHAPTCEAYVGQNPSAFKDMYWEINSLKVFSGSSGPAAPGQSYAPSGSYGAQSTFARSTVAASGAPSGAPFGRPHGPASQAPSYAPAPSGGPSPSYVPPSANPVPSGAAPLPSWAPQPSSPYQGPPGGGARATAGGAIHGGAHRGPPGAEAARANYLAAHMENMPTIQQRETESLDNAAIIRHARNHLEQHKRWHGHGHGHF